MARIMGIDQGDVRTGVALSDPGELLASGLCTVTAYTEEKLLSELLRLIETHKPEKIVMGLPVNMDGSRGARAEKVSAFAAKLAEASGVEVILSDERCTTVVAHGYLNETLKHGSKKRKKVIDTLSAEIILQDYLDAKRKDK